MVGDNPHSQRPQYDTSASEWQADRAAAAAGGGSPPKGLRRPLTLWALLGIILLAAALRFVGLDWDEGQHLHPDERFLTMVTASLEWPKSLAEYFDTSLNPLNPYNHGYGSYVYGLSPVVMAKAVGEVLGWTGYDGVYLAGRAMSGVMDLVSLVLIFLIGRRLYGTREGLAGAFLYAFTVLSIQHSHFFTVDMTMTAYITLALYFAVRLAQGGGWGDMLGLGVAFGLAVSAKISVLTFLLVIALAFVLRAASRREADPPAPADLVSDWKARLGRFDLTLRLRADPQCGPLHLSDRLLMWAVPALLAICAILLVAFVTFRIAQPQAFNGPGFWGLSLNPDWRADMVGIQKLVSGEVDYPPSHQWAGREPVWYSLKNMVLWGLGLPLGLAVWVAWVLMAYEMFKGRWAHLLPWTWMTLTFFYQSVQFVKTVRYMLPIYPTMALMAGYAVVRLWDLARDERQRRGRRWPQLAASGAAIVVFLGTVLWALAFSTIYTRPVTRVEASRWIYEHIPVGSTISYEYWDDPLPLNVDGFVATNMYEQVRMDLYWEDTPEKREALYDWLERTEYIILSSNRLYGSIPRLPMRYPMTTRYYEALFSGELGFEPLMTFTSRPRLFGMEIVDDNADETFTVYDHPKVIIFKKGPQFSMARVHALFDGYDLVRVVRIQPKQVSAAPNGLMLSEDAWEGQRQGGTWRDLFDPDSLANRFPTLTWLLILALVGCVAFPIGFVGLGHLGDGGQALSRMLGILLAGYVPWLGASLGLVPYSRATIVGGLLALSVLSGFLAWRQREEIGRFLRARWRIVLVNEAMFLLFFLAFWAIRRVNPDLWHPVTGGEKPMDLAYLNAIVKSTTFPPYDPWFAGGYLNYYYMGHLLVATLIKLTGIVPTVAYNLAIPTLFALTAMGACCAVSNLVPTGDDEDSWLPRAQRYGLAGAFLVAVMGNLAEVKLLWDGLRMLGQGAVAGWAVPGLEAFAQVGAGIVQVVRDGASLPFRPEWWYWNASRVMTGGEINEFPFFSFLYADLHAHVIALPLTLLVLGLALAMLAAEGKRRDPESGGSGFWPAERDLHTLLEPLVALGWKGWLHLALLALALGALWAGNTWDYPTYMGISLLIIGIGVYQERGRVDLRALLDVLWRSLLVIVASLLLFLPYHRNYGAAYSSFALWRGERTSPSAYVLIHGLFLFVIYSYLAARLMAPGLRNSLVRSGRLLLRYGRSARAQRLYERLVRCPSILYDLSWFGIAALGAILVVAVWVGAWPLASGLVLALGALVLLCDRGSSAQERVLGVLIGAGAMLTAGVEYVVLKGDIGRMNTVFKFYMQVWVLWGIAAAVGLAYLGHRRGRRRAGRLWSVILVALLLGASLYPVCATAGKIQDRWDPTLPAGLDGSAYMRTAQYEENGRLLTLSHDLAAIRWLQENVAGSPVIAEANAPLYHWGSRISVYTGLPTIIGWDWHERQQRAAYSGIVVDWRLEDVSALYNSTDVAQKREVLQRYEVSYIYVGELEQALYDAEGLATFEAMVGEDLEIAYEQTPVTIYRVIEGLHEQVPRARRPPLIESLAEWLSRNAFWGPVCADRPEDDPAAASASQAMLDRPVEELPVVNNRGWNPIGRSTIGAIISWWVVMQAVGLAAWPLVAGVARPLLDGGYGLTKGIGLLLAGYVVWLSASTRVMANGPPAAWAALGLVVLLSFLCRDGRRRVASAWRRQRSLILMEEALFTIGFATFVIIRLANPDLWHPWFGGEKPMEVAYLNAITKSAYMPPYDPYWAGGSINYYYYGQYLMAYLMELTGLPPEVGFNLAVPTLFGLTICHSFVIGSTLGQALPQGEQEPKRRRVFAGLGAALMVAVMGNLCTMVQLAAGLADLGGAGAILGRPPNAAALLAAVPTGFVRLVRGEGSLSLDYWYGATRIIPYTINEFPFFSFLFADLHPHLIAIPFALALLGLMLCTAKDAHDGALPRMRQLAMVALALGALGPMNTWDLPTYSGLLLLLALYEGFRLEGQRGLLRGTGLAAATLGGGLLLYTPFYLHYEAPNLGLGWVPPESRSPFGAFMAVWGTHLFLLVSIVAARLLATRGGGTSAEMGMRRVARGAPLVLGGVAAAALLAAGEPLVGFLVFLLGAMIAARPALNDAAQFHKWLLSLMGVAILLGSELVYVRDFLAGSEWLRMNTVFKFHMAAWVLLSVALGSILPSLWGWVTARRSGLSAIWKVAATALLVVAFSYPVWSIPQRCAQRFPGVSAPAWTLDGTAYMRDAVYYWPDQNTPIYLKYDREAVEWLWRNVPGSPVIAEAGLGYYREGGLRISSYTGLPTILGMHANEQRPWQEVALRQADLDDLYNTTDVDRLWEILERYLVRYIYVGQLERIIYSPEGLAKFEELLQEGLLSQVYANEGATIYRVGLPRG